MIRWLRAVRALTRIEWRQAAAHRARTSLVVLLVAVPVAAVVGASTLARITSPTPEERARQAMGVASLRVEIPDATTTFEKLAPILPVNVPTTRFFAGRESVTIPGRSLPAALIAAPPSALDAGGGGAGMLELVRGRWPAQAGEVALSAVLLDAMRISLADTVTLADGEPSTIVGVAAVAENLDTPVVVRNPRVTDRDGRTFVLVHANEHEASSLASALRGAGLAVRTRAEAAEIAGGLQSLALTAGSIGFIEAALVIAAAFVVSLRRRQYEIGLAGTAGASPPEITAAMLLAAAGLATLGGGLGIGLGLGAARTLHPYLDAWNGRLNGPFEVVPGDAASAFLLGLATAVVAAWAPVRHTVQVPLRESLGATKPSPPHGRSAVAAAVGCIALGLALMVVPLPKGEAPALLLLVGRPILVIVGLGLASPAILGGLGRLAAQLPMVWRLAVRDASRFRSRNGPVVTAVLVGMSLTVTAAAIIATIQAKLDVLPAAYRDDQMLVAGPGANVVALQLQREMGGVAIAPLQMAGGLYGALRVQYEARPGARPGRDWVACGDVELLRALNAQSAAAALRSGALVVLGAPEVGDSIALVAPSGTVLVSSPRVHHVAIDQRVSGPRFVLSSEALSAMGLEPRPAPGHEFAPYVVRLARPVTRSELDRARERAAAVPGTAVDAALLHARPTRTIYLVAWVVCTLTSLVVVLVATALAAAESAPDEVVLRAIGAAPALLRRHAATRAGYIALLGCVLAIPAGLFSALALLHAANFAVELRWRWRDLVLLLVVLPAAAYAGAWLAANPRASLRQL